METYLVHHGIKGQKWGVRRYQNEDGTYTEEGKKRRRFDIGDWFEPKIKSGKDKSPVSKAEKLTKGAEKTVDSSEKLYETIKNIKDRKKNARINADLEKKISKMSTEELKTVVNRMNLEKQYKDAVKSREYDDGKVSAQEVIQTIGAIVGIAGGVVAIATAFKH